MGKSTPTFFTPFFHLSIKCSLSLDEVCGLGVSGFETLVSQCPLSGCLKYAIGVELND